MSTTTRILHLGCSTVFAATGAALKGAVHTAETAASVTDSLVAGRPMRALNVGRKYLEGIADAATGIGATALALGSDAIDCIEGKRSTFLTKRNEKRIVQLGAAAALIAAGGCLADLADISADLPRTDDFVCPEHGAGCSDFFNGNEADLQDLILEGELEDTTHINAEDIVRSEVQRQAFFAVHGLEELPEGAELHHIIPLSEGGADSPENMTIVAKNDHHLITAAHADYYGWSDMRWHK